MKLSRCVCVREFICYLTLHYVGVIYGGGFAHDYIPLSALSLTRHLHCHVQTELAKEMADAADKHAEDMSNAQASHEQQIVQLQVTMAEYQVGDPSVHARYCCRCDSCTCQT